MGLMWDLQFSGLKTFSIFSAIFFYPANEVDELTIDSKNKVSLLRSFLSRKNKASIKIQKILKTPGNHSKFNLFTGILHFYNLKFTVGLYGFNYHKALEHGSYF